MSLILTAALERQKRLLLLFVLTILLPSASLAFFAIRALRNESFRLAKQVENEYRAAADGLEARISAALEDVEQALLNLAQRELFLQRRYKDMDLASSELISELPLVEQVFVAYSGEEPFFPILESFPGGSMQPPSAPLPAALANLLRQAQKYEFEETDCNRAIALYEKIGAAAQDRNFQAQMLAGIGRCLMKLGRLDRALTCYRKISTDFPDCFTANGIPMEPAARLQMAECRRLAGDTAGALGESLQLYRDLLQKPWSMDQDRFAAWSSIVEEMLTELTSSNASSIHGEEIDREFAVLKTRHRERKSEYELAHTLREEVIPALVELAGARQQDMHAPIRYSRALEQRSLLLLAAMLPGPVGLPPMGMIGTVINNRVLENSILTGSVAGLQCSVPPRIVVSSLSGEVIHGTDSEETATVTLVFKEGFPPWKIEIFRAQPQLSAVLQMSKSFYFWTIPVLFLILLTGAALTVQTIARQVRILDLQSDLVSSVTHEFKTPLASMSALLERLRDGKVKEVRKAEQYYSVMSADVETLNRLVNNILSAARIEEGKAAYTKVRTDMRSWLHDFVSAFGNSRRDSDIALTVQIAEDLPHLCIDPDSIAMALSNLLDNAVKFSQEKKEICFLACREGGDVVLEIQDFGIGIPPDELDHVFDKFYRGREALKLSVKGLGLGLATAKHCIEGHGGKLAVESRIGEGTTFRIILPGEGGGGPNDKEAAHH